MASAAVLNWSVFSAHAEVVPIGEIEEPQGLRILRARGGSSVHGAV